MRDPNSVHLRRNSNWRPCIWCKRRENLSRKWLVTWELLTVRCTTGVRNGAKPGEKAFVGSGNPAAGEEEIRRLKRELQFPRQEHDLLKKSTRHLFARPELSYPFIAEYASQYAVSTMCRVLGVSVSGYYDWRGREPSRHAREDGEIAQVIHRIFHTHRGCQGQLTFGS